MLGRGSVFISHSQEDAARCAPLLAALDAWGVEYVFEGPHKGNDLQLSERTQEAISDAPVFLRICTNAIKRSYWMSLEAGAFLGLQSDDHRQGRGEARMLVNLILDRDYTLEPFDRAGALIDATREQPSAWVNRLREALGLPPLTDVSGLGLERMLTASGVARRRLIAGGLAVGVLAVAGGAVAVARSGALTLPKFVESTPTATPLVRARGEAALDGGSGTDDHRDARHRRWGRLRRRVGWRPLCAGRQEPGKEAVELHRCQQRPDLRAAGRRRRVGLFAWA